MSGTDKTKTYAQPERGLDGVKPLLARLERDTKRTFRDPQLPALALTHSSFAHEQSKHAGGEHNERLEFLGDAVLELAVSEWLYTHFPSAPEGELARIRSAVVREPVLARLALGLGIGAAMRLGRGEDQAGGRMRPSLLADALEAVVGAVYLDAGWEVARSWVVAQVADEIARVSSGVSVNPKGVLQERLQGAGLATPSYRVVKAAGPDHRPTFVVDVIAGEQVLATGTGPSKKEAERDAALKALQLLEGPETKNDGLRGNKGVTL